MKRLLLVLVCGLLALSGMAQEGEKRPMQVADYEGVKKVSIQNLEKDTYVKASPFVLDRSFQPFVFKFSDGIVRKVYLFKLYESEKMAELGMVAIYTTSKDAKRVVVPIPSPDAAPEVWGKYIDDLKYGERDHLGLASCLAFVLTKAGVGGASATPGKEEDKYEYCFPAESQVTMADGSHRAIADLEPGDRLLSYNPAQQRFETATVQRLDLHQNDTFGLVQIGLVHPNEKLTAGPARWSLKTIEATPNHPLSTPNGRKTFGQMQVGERAYWVADGIVEEYEVFVKKANGRRVERVYNVVTDKPHYVVNGVLVMTK